MLNDEELRISGTIGTNGKTVVGAFGVVTGSVMKRIFIHSTYLRHWRQGRNDVGSVSRMIDTGEKTAARAVSVSVRLVLVVPVEPP